MRIFKKDMLKMLDSNTKLKCYKGFGGEFLGEKQLKEWSADMLRNELFFFTFIIEGDEGSLDVLIEYTLSTDHGINDEYHDIIQHTKYDYSRLYRSLYQTKERKVKCYQYRNNSYGYLWLYDSRRQLLIISEEGGFSLEVACSRDKARELLTLPLHEINNFKESQDQDFDDYQEAKEQAKKEEYEGTQEDFEEDYISLKITIIEEAMDPRISNQTHEILKSKKGLCEDLLEKIQGFDVRLKYDEQTYITPFRRKQCTNYNIRYILKLSRPLYTVEQDLFNNEFSKWWF
jgi:hypothetical protein